MTIRAIVPWKAEVFQFSVVVLKSHMKPITPWSPLKAIKQHRNSLNLCLISICGFSIPVTGWYAHMQTRGRVCMERPARWREKRESGLTGSLKSNGKHTWMMENTHEWGLRLSHRRQCCWNNMLERVLLKYLQYADRQYLTAKTQYMTQTLVHLLKSPTVCAHSWKQVEYHNAQIWRQIYYEILTRLQND